MKKFVLALFALVCSIGCAWAQTQETEQQKIDYLIHSVETLKSAVFIRNGTEYDAQKAAEHMRMKLRYAGDRIKTVEEFIDGIATASSMSGKKYQIKFEDGRTVESAVYLRDLLKQFGAKAVSSAAVSSAG